MSRGERRAQVRSETASLRESDRHGWLVLLGLGGAQSSSGEQVAREKASRLAALAGWLPIVDLGAGALLLMTLALGADPHALILPAALIGFVVLSDMVLALLLRRGRARKSPPQQLAWLATVVAVISGVAWAMLLAFVDAGPQAVEAAIMAVSCGGLISILLLSAVPAPAIARGSAGMVVLAVLFPTAIGTVAGVATLLVMAWVLMGRTRVAQASIDRQFSVERQAHQARHLLAEFEESGRGWFWETDPDGRLTYLTPQLVQSLKRDITDVAGRPFAELIAHEDEAPEGERTIGFHLSARFAFSEVVVRVASHESQRWWSITGRPAFDQYGRYLGFRGSGTDLTEMRRSEAEVKRLARYDALTGLPNRVLMRQTLEEALTDAARGGDECALLLLDLDRFKSVNDTLGHPVGDVLLRQVGERLLSVIGESGRVGRLGGDEFNIVIPRVIDRAHLGLLADAVIGRLSLPYLIEGSTISIGASVGIAIGPGDGVGADALVRNADLALYKAKADGKGVHRFYEAEMHANAKDRRLLEVDLRNAMKDEGLHLVYQPVVKADNERIVGFEALARWKHPTRGMVSPAEFIPIAEEIGLIARIGEWVLRTACLEAANWPDHVRVAVNISPIQFANPQLPAIVLSALAEAQLPPGRLELEITEGVFVNESPATDQMFSALKGIGVRLALDDFGTGYSSLGYLKKAPFDKIKIDQSFVRGAAVRGNRNAALIRAIVALADSLDMETTAEGAETHDELDLIRALGCSHIQGYIFGRPMPAEEARERVLGTGTLSAKGFQQGRPPRVAVLRAAMLHGDRGSVPVRIRNISEQGVMIESDHIVAIGTTIVIEFPEGERMSGIVRWTQPGRFGMQLNQMFDLEKLNAPKPALSGSALRRRVG